MFGEEKAKYLEAKIKQGLAQVDEMEKKLTSARIELETDQTMLLRHKQEMEEEQFLIKQLGEKVGVRAQAVEKLEVQQKIR